MSRLSLEEIGERIQAFLGGSALADDVVGVRVEEADDQPDEDMLHVLVILRHPKRSDLRTMVPLADEIRTELRDRDDRFLLFRFPEAA